MEPASPLRDELSLGFVDDVVHMVADKDTRECVAKLERPANDSLSWARRHGAVFDLKKSQFMIFTHKRQATGFTLQFGMKTLAQKTEVKWLGVWFDQKLLFNRQIQHVKKVGTITLKQLRRVSRCYSGLYPRECKKLATSVVYPRVLYGYQAWLTQQTANKAAKNLDPIQNHMNGWITGAFKGSSNALASHDANTTTFFTAATRLTLTFLTTRLTSPENSLMNRFIGHEFSTTGPEGPIRCTLSSHLLEKQVKEGCLERIRP